MPLASNGRLLHALADAVAGSHLGRSLWDPTAWHGFCSALSPDPDVTLRITMVLGPTLLAGSLMLAAALGSEWPILLVAVGLSMWSLSPIPLAPAPL